MPFNHLLFESLLPGKTKAEDNKRASYTSAELKPKRDEAVLLFRLDSDATRTRLGPFDKKCCDFLFLYRSEAKCLLIFVELKGDEIGAAPTQLANAIDAICDRAPGGSSWRKFVRAVIVAPTFAVQTRKTIQPGMRQGRGIQVFFGISKKGHACDIRNVEQLAEDFR
jgi:hypothetical protein